MDVVCEGVSGLSHFRRTERACRYADCWNAEPLNGTWRAHKDDWPCLAGGEKELTVHCLGCYHQAVKTF